MEGGTSDDMDFYWDACDRAMREEAIATGSDAADARRFRSSAFPPPEVDESLECVSVTLLPDGDLHVCFGTACPHARMDPRSRSWTCELTGHELGTSPAHESDPTNTGRSVASANPDDTSGVPRGGWRRKKDQWSASVHAHVRSYAIDANEDVLCGSTGDASRPATRPRATARAPSKRGAQCVDVREPDQLGPAPQEATPAPAPTPQTVATLSLIHISEPTRPY